MNRVRSKIRALPIWLNHIDERWDPGEVNDGVVVVNGNGGDVLRSGSGESGDVGKELVGPDLHGVIKQRVTLPIA